MRMKYHIKQNIAALLLAILAASCGEMFEVNNETPFSGTIALNDRSIDLMVGDRYVLPKVIKPDSLANISLYWSSDDKTVVSFAADTAVATNPGTTWVRVTMVGQQVSDSCKVTVHPVWQQFDPTQFRYDMLFFANVTVNGKAIGQDAVVGAFNTEGEQRGVGTMMQATDGTPYMMMRIYSHEAADEDILLKCYDRSRVKVVQASDTIVFYSDETLPLGGLYNLKFD